MTFTCHLRPKLLEPKMVSVCIFRRTRTMQQQDSCSMTPPNSPLVAVPMETQEVEELKPIPGTIYTWQLLTEIQCLNLSL